MGTRPLVGDRCERKSVGEQQAQIVSLITDTSMEDSATAGGGFLHLKQLQVEHLKQLQVEGFCILSNLGYAYLRE